MVFFFKQKTAYEVRISDWSSDVCSSDLHRRPHRAARGPHRRRRDAAASARSAPRGAAAPAPARVRSACRAPNRAACRGRRRLWRAGQTRKRSRAKIQFRPECGPGRLESTIGRARAEEREGEEEKIKVME